MSHICNTCKHEKSESEIIILTCKHVFCWTCIYGYLKSNLKNKNKCPVLACTQLIKDNEVRKILSDEDIARYDDICLRTVSGIYVCVLPECGAVTLHNSLNIQFDCSSCSVYNCVQCKLAHKGMRCGDLLTHNGVSLAIICQKELQRARSVLQTKRALRKRADIIESDKIVLVSNPSIFNCELCCTDVGKKNGVMLRGCFHEICRNCLKEHIKSSSLIPVPCPFSPCQSTLEDRECREILSEEEMLIYELKSLKRASVYLDRPERCREPNCSYMGDLAVGVRSWSCPKCHSVNCVACNTIHCNQTCEEYSNKKTMTKDERKIEELIKKKELMRCPDCGNIIKKTGGCNWIPCLNCGVELCWINQIHRWGPAGPGDTSGGCKCGVDNKRCHPSCTGCIADTGRRHERYASLRLPRTTMNGSTRLNRQLDLFNPFEDRLERPLPLFATHIDPLNRRNIFGASMRRVARSANIRRITPQQTEFTRPLPPRTNNPDIVNISEET